MLKALKKMFGKAEDEQQQPAPSPVAAPAQSGDAEQKRPRKNKPARTASESAGDSPAPQQPRPPKADKPRRERPAKPVDTWKLEDFVVEPAGYTLKGQDAIGRAQTGTGKTAAFLISIITQLLQTPPPKERYMGEPRALIIAPTRELVVQIAKDAAELTKYTGLNVMQFVGGMDFDKQLKQLESRFCDILVATPGRLLDFNQRGEVHLDMVEVMVLDEADRMLDMGF
ncbi:MAG: ATP-dependent RNA helicase RhlB, partial [Ectopseudomonas oleovorans]